LKLPTALHNPFYQASKANAWPNLRDVANFAVGFVSLAILRVLFALVEAL